MSCIKNHLDDLAYEAAKKTGADPYVTSYAIMEGNDPEEAAKLAFRFDFIIFQAALLNHLNFDALHQYAVEMLNDGEKILDAADYIYCAVQDGMITDSDII